MSGPTTVVITGEPVSTLLAAAAIRAAQAIREGYERAAELRAQHAASQQAQGAAQAAAVRQGMQALESEASAIEARIERLATLSAKLGAAEQARAARPVRPAAGDPVALAAYIRGLDVFSAELQSILLTEAARRKEELDTAAPELAVPAAAARAAPEHPSRRLLARIAHLGAPPPDIEKLARELDGTASGQRADLLASELRRRIQDHIEETQRRLVEEATATIVQRSLEDLGYQVEEISETLFVEGGVAHFRRRDWGDYMVRMRVDPRGSGANFNVVRAVDAAAREPSVADHLAEDRWCAEFPALLNALEARGVRLAVTRRLAAGEVPVQQVERGRLPEFAREETGATARKRRANRLK